MLRIAPQGAAPSCHIGKPMHMSVLAPERLQIHVANPILAKMPKRTTNQQHSMAISRTHPTPACVENTFRILFPYGAARFPNQCPTPPEVVRSMSFTEVIPEDPTSSSPAHRPFRATSRSW